MASGGEKKDNNELEERVRQGETVVPGGTGGGTLEAQKHLAEGRSKGGQARRTELDLNKEPEFDEGHKKGSMTVGGSVTKTLEDIDEVPVDELGQQKY